MKIKIEHSDGSAFSIKFPNWLVFNRLGISFAAKSIVKSGKLGVSVNASNEALQDVSQKLSKKELKLSAKKMKRALLLARGELRGFLKRNPEFVLVDVLEAGGEHVKIIF